MKQKIYQTGTVSLMVIAVGVIFKLLHYPGASILITLGFIGITLIFFPLGLISALRREEQPALKMLYIVSYITILVVFTSMLFKLLHWPGAGILLMISLPLPFVLFLPAFVYTTSRIPGYSTNRIVLVILILTFMSVFNAFMAVNVSKDSLDYSAQVASLHAGNLELKKEIASIENSEQTPLNDAINRLYSLLEQVENEILNRADASQDMLISDPSSIKYLDSSSIPAMVLEEGEERYGGASLDAAVKAVVEAASLYLAGSLTKDDIMDLLLCNPENIEESSWSNYMFSGNWTSWSLVYIEMLKSNLLLISGEIE